MDLGYVYFNTSGRINRQTYWLQGVLLLNGIWIGIWTVLVILVVNTAGGISPEAVLYYSILGLSDPSYFQTALGRIVDMLGPFSLLIIFSYPIYMWNGYAVTVKRLHDRNKPAWWVVIWAMCITILAFIPIVGVLAILGIYIWMLVELGFLEGTDGSNIYGATTTGYSSYPSASPRGTKICPHCSKLIWQATVICSYCGYNTGPRTAGQAAQPAYGAGRQPVGSMRSNRPTLASQNTKSCPICGEPVLQMAARCPHVNCQADIRAYRYTKPCQSCGNLMMQSAVNCPTCGAAPQAAYQQAQPMQPVQQQGQPAQGVYQQGQPLQGVPQQGQPAQPYQQAQPVQAQEARRMKVCPSCAESVPYETTNCPRCRADI